MLVFADGPQREIGLAFLAEAREDVEGDRFSYAMLGFLDVLAATAKAAAGDLDAAIELSRRATDQLLPHRGKYLADTPPPSWWNRFFVAAVVATSMKPMRHSPRRSRNARSQDGGVAISITCAHER